MFILLLFLFNLISAGDNSPQDHQFIPVSAADDDQMAAIIQHKVNLFNLKENIF